MRRYRHHLRLRQVKLHSSAIHHVPGLKNRSHTSFASILTTLLVIHPFVLLVLLLVFWFPLLFLVRPRLPRLRVAEREPHEAQRPAGLRERRLLANPQLPERAQDSRHVHFVRGYNQLTERPPQGRRDPFYESEVQKAHFVGHCPLDQDVPWVGVAVEHAVDEDLLRKRGGNVLHQLLGVGLGPGLQGGLVRGLHAFDELEHQYSLRGPHGNGDHGGAGRWRGRGFGVGGRTEGGGDREEVLNICSCPVPQLRGSGHF
mmetsp:Transcript_6645/g.16295  ORF Transcript_6645/g.16295 Transcript_6645/m.16295 type:complete len:258 (+) Transcript_6645:2669-3442(+)